MKKETCIWFVNYSTADNMKFELIYGQGINYFCQPQRIKINYSYQALGLESPTKEKGQIGGLS